MKLRKSSIEVIKNEKEKYELIRHELFEMGVREYTLTNMTNCIYLASVGKVSIEMVTDDYEG